jgi:hypothetical protein
MLLCDSDSEWSCIIVCVLGYKDIEQSCIIVCDLGVHPKTYYYT